MRQASQITSRAHGSRRPAGPTSCALRLQSLARPLPPHQRQQRFQLRALLLARQRKAQRMKQRASLHPVAALTALVHAPQVSCPGLGRQHLRRMAEKRRILDDRCDLPLTTSHHACIGSTTRFPRTASQNASPPEIPMRLEPRLDIRIGELVQQFRVQAFSSSRSKRPGAVEILAKSNSAASSSTSRCGSIASDVPISAAWLSTAIGSRPASRKLRTDSAPKRLDSAARPPRPAD